MAKSVSILTLLLLAAAAHAADPTRPPAAFMPRDKAEAGVPAAPVVDLSGLQLQSVFLSPTRRSAILNGETYSIGDSVRGARLVEIGESHVVLLGPQGRQRIELTPGVRKGAPGSLLPRTARDGRRITTGDIR